MVLVFRAVAGLLKARVVYKNRRDRTFKRFSDEESQKQTNALKGSTLSRTNKKDLSNLEEVSPTFENEVTEKPSENNAPRQLSPYKSATPIAENPVGRKSSELDQSKAEEDETEDDVGKFGDILASKP